MVQSGRCVQTLRGNIIHTVSHPVGTGPCLPESKAARSVKQTAQLRINIVKVKSLCLMN
jgi:hypothetical protein